MSELSPPEQTRLSQLETTVETGLRTFQEVGTALAEIRDTRLYKATHNAFEEYLSERWGITARRGYQLIGASESVKDFSHSVGNEAHATALANLPADVREPAYQLITRLGKTSAKTLRAFADLPEGHLEAVLAMGETEPEMVPLVADLVKNTSNGRPTPSQVRSLAAVAYGIINNGVIDVEDGEQVLWEPLSWKQKTTYLMTQMSYETYEREQQHRANSRRTEKAQLNDAHLDRVTIPKKKYLALKQLAALAPVEARKTYYREWGEALGTGLEER